MCFKYCIYMYFYIYTNIKTGKIYKQEHFNLYVITNKIADAISHVCVHETNIGVWQFEYRACEHTHIFFQFRLYNRKKNVFISRLNIELVTAVCCNLLYILGNALVERVFRVTNICYIYFQFSHMFSLFLKNNRINRMNFSYVF